jgi:N-acetyl-anhydromuramyl-L-alanine amidase AmpD
MTYKIRAASPAPAKFTRRGRPGGIRSVAQIQIHATRGATAMDLQVQATEGWFAQQPDRGGWGGSADFVVGPDRRAAGEIVIVQFGDWRRTFSSWSAGYGGSGAATEYGAAEVGVAIEVAQPDNSTPFTPATVEAVAWLCAQISNALEDEGVSRIPRRHIAHWSQRRAETVPRGYIGHDELANGIKLVKSDPGRLWDWSAFLGAVGRHEYGHHAATGVSPEYLEATADLEAEHRAIGVAVSRAKLATGRMSAALE